MLKKKKELKVALNLLHICITFLFHNNACIDVIFYFFYYYIDTSTLIGEVLLFFKLNKISLIRTR